MKLEALAWRTGEKRVDSKLGEWKRRSRASGRKAEWVASVRENVLRLWLWLSCKLVILLIPPLLVPFWLLLWLFAETELPDVELAFLGWLRGRPRLDVGYWSPDAWPPFWPLHLCVRRLDSLLNILEHELQTKLVVKSSREFEWTFRCWFRLESWMNALPQSNLGHL